MTRLLPVPLAVCAVSAVLALGACTSASPSAAPATTPVTSRAAAPTSSSPASSRSSRRPAGATHRATPTHAPSTRATPTRAPSTHAPAPRPQAGAPVIVIDPGHSVTVHATDPATGLDVSDYENEPEMTDVWAVAQLVRSRLQAAGYRVVLTKPTLRTPTSLGARAAVANRVHAALALSIHDQAGSNGGIGFSAGNNIVYYQSVGDYRDTRSGHRVTFTDSAVAATSRRYAAIFARARQAAQGASIRVQGDTGYNLGGRGLPAGNIWLVQLLSHVPWIYNEAGGNSPGMSGLDSRDRQRYADGLVRAVEACVPLR